MKRVRLFLSVVLLGPVGALADIMDAQHLDVVPRTEAEAARVAEVTALATRFDRPQPSEAQSAGDATVPVLTDAQAFTLPSANLPEAERSTFQIGRTFFRKRWVPAPASTQASDGLGPLFNAASCESCHRRNGRSFPPDGFEDSAASLVLKLSIPGNPEALPDPIYGTQLQDQAVAGQVAEGRVKITYEEVEVALSGGEIATLRAPSYAATDLGYGPMHPDVRLSPRVAPQMIGLGLLEAVPAEDLLAWADPEDSDGDGISGRPNSVWSVEHEQPMLGRFGLKAGTPTLRHQAALALSRDMGLSNPLFPDPWGTCTEAQTDCRAAPHGDGDVRGTEVDAAGLDLITFYSRNLGVPARRDVDDPEVLRGKEVFYTTGCTACHRPSFVTLRLQDHPEQSFQLIWPYTDLLLHDMGPGLADNRPEARATGREWRTPPLWGIGLTAQVSGRATFLHDGRARSLLEALLWHGGEAQSQRDAVVAMPPKDRAALLRFLESL